MKKTNIAILVIVLIATVAAIVLGADRFTDGKIDKKNYQNSEQSTSTTEYTNTDIEGNNFASTTTEISTSTKPVTSTNNGKGRCYVGGCSGQICGEDKGIVSTCEYKEEYSCYKSASCERQSNGKCGWTQTEELKLCLSGGFSSSR